MSGVIGASIVTTASRSGARNVPISGITLTCLLHLKAYGRFDEQDGGEMDDRVVGP